MAGTTKGAVMGRKSKNENAAVTIAKIAKVLSGVEIDAQVAGKVADIMFEAGHEIPPPDPARMPPACCPACAKRDKLYVHETAVISFEYDPQRHTGNTDTEVTEHSNEDYTGYCGGCQHKGTLAEFRMALVDWTNDCDLEDEDEDDDDDGE